MSQVIFYPNWKGKVVYSTEGPQPQSLMETEHVKVVVAGLLAGQKIPAHPESSGMYHFLEGTGWMIVDDERFAVEPGATVIVPAEAKRGIEANTKLAFLAVRAV